MKITFLVHSLYTIGGTIRTTLNTAVALADRGHNVSLISVFQHRQTPLFTLDERLTHHCLIDVRSSAPPLQGTDARLAAKPSKIVPATEPRADQYSRLTDARVREALENCDADVIVGTRPGLNLYVSKFAPSSAATVGQEHLFLQHHDRRLTATLKKSYRRLGAITTVSDADAQDYRRAMPGIAERVRHIPNAIPVTNLPMATGDSPIIVAAGRLEKVKRYDLLLAAFAKVVESHPEWQLRIYGHGKESDRLRELVKSHGLHNNVFLMGTYTPIDAEWVKGSIAAVTSDVESFGLTIVEAMGCGLPVVATACPHGPPEIITDTSDGLLTPPGNVDAFASALCQLIENPDNRKKMGMTAQDTAQRYLPSRIAAEYEQLFATLCAESSDDTASVGNGDVSNTQIPHIVSRSASFAQVTVSLPRQLRGRNVTLDSENDSVALDSEHGEVTIGPDVTTKLREDTWVMHVDGIPAPSGQIDTRALVSPPETIDGNIVIPAAVSKQLAFRVWRRSVYAEVDGLSVDDEAIVVAGTLYGPVPDMQKTAATLTLRDDPAQLLELAATRDFAQFRVHIPTSVLADAHHGHEQLWDLRIRVADQNVRVGKKLDDLAKRKKVHKFPGCGDPAGTVAIKPYFTINNGLSVKVSRAS